MPQRGSIVLARMTLQDNVKAYLNMFASQPVCVDGPMLNRISTVNQTYTAWRKPAESLQSPPWEQFAGLQTQTEETWVPSALKYFYSHQLQGQRSHCSQRWFVNLCPCCPFDCPAGHMLSIYFSSSSRRAIQLIPRELDQGPGKSVGAIRTDCPQMKICQVLWVSTVLLL